MKTLSVTVRDNGLEVERVEFKREEDISEYNDCSGHYAEGIFGYDKALVGGFGVRMKPRPDHGLKELPKLSEDERTQLIDGKAIGIQKLPFKGSRTVIPKDHLHVTLNLDHMQLKREYEINENMTLKGVTCFKMNDALGYTQATFAVIG